MDGDIIELNVGGVPYTTTKQTLCGGVEPGSMLAAIVNSGLPSRRDATGRIFIDRDGLRFRAVLNYLRSASFHCSHDRTALRELAEEAEFFGLEHLLKKVNAELARIELEEDLGSMSSALSEQQKCNEPGLRSSPRSTQAFEFVYSQDSASPQNKTFPRDEPVVRILDFGAPTPSPACANASTSASPKTNPKSVHMEHHFTLDADF